ncbi:MULTISPECIES: hypothetical protein [Protofrankia]|uniref:hypothetical protein n=1 Tax=Protofrankia TaxID=2994361 RepID=UPI0002F68D2A|nr:MULTISPECIES: hypothetical protein [Protofrankia]
MAGALTEPSPVSDPAEQTTAPPVADEATGTRRRSRERNHRAAGALAAVGRLPRASGRVVLRHPVAVLAVLAAVVLASTISSILLARANAHTDKVEAARSAALEAAKQNAAALLSYDYQTIDRDTPTRGDRLTGQFKDDYARLVTDLVTPAAKQRKLVTKTSVAMASVISADTDKVQVLTFLNQTSQAQDTPQPVLTGSRVRITMEHINGRWLVSELTPL